MMNWSNSFRTAEIYHDSNILTLRMIETDYEVFKDILF